jgi:peptidoglycan/LPS O-acetylase OafA/YrhL
MSSLLAQRVSYSQTDSCSAVAVPPAGVGGHVPALDGIRGLAVLLVLIFHVFQVEPVPSHPVLRMGYAATLFGQTGVDLFFVLSGFLITGILLDSRASRRYFTNFYGRRTLRIFPLYYGSLVLFLVVLPRLVDVHVSGLSPVWFWTFSTNVAATHGLNAGGLGHYWTLAIEEQFYLVWPFVVFALSRAALIRACVASLVAAAALRVLVESRGISCFMITFCRIDTLVLGALLALAARSPRGLPGLARAAFWVGPVAIAVALPLCASMRGSGSIWLQGVKYPLIAVFYAAIMVIGITASAGSWAGRLVTLSPLRSLGKYSYGIYVFHPPLIEALRSWLRSPVAAQAIGGMHGGPLLALKLTLIFGASYALAYLSWHLYEKHFLVLKRHFEYDRAV